MGTWTRTAALTAAVAAAGAALAGCGGLSVGIDTKDSAYDVTEKVTGLSVRGDGSVTVTGSDSPGVHVVERLRWSNGRNRPKTSHAVTGGTLNLNAECDDRRSVGFNVCRVSYEVRVPRAMAVTFDGDTGNITVSNVTGALRLHTDIGAIRVPDLQADRFDASTGTGDIKVGGRADVIVLKARDGDVELNLTGPVSNAQAFTGTGNVRLWLPGDSGYALVTTVGTGKKKINPAVRQDPRSARRITASTQTGDVVVEAADR